MYNYCSAAGPITSLWGCSQIYWAACPLISHYVPYYIAIVLLCLQTALVNQSRYFSCQIVSIFYSSISCTLCLGNWICFWKLTFMEIKLWFTIMGTSLITGIHTSRCFYNYWISLQNQECNFHLSLPSCIVTKYFFTQCIRTEAWAT